MKRFFTDYLAKWKDRNSRKPLMIRGARQVGKTFIVREFGRVYFENTIEINFDENAGYASLFNTNDIDSIKLNIEAITGQKIIPSKTLLFLDEIQFCPEAIRSLRYFYEKMPELHVISAGSLLDFALNDFPYSMPVGRIEFAYLYPMSFKEFLWALNQEGLALWMEKYQITQNVPLAIHQKLIHYLRLYFTIGGMPEAVKNFCNTQSLTEVSIIHESIVKSFEFDFSKYGNKKQQMIMARLLQYIPKTLGQKFKYTGFDSQLRSGEIKKSLQLLSMSRIIHLVFNTKASAPPLETGSNHKTFKTIFLDIGLVNHILNLRFVDLQQYFVNNEGGLAEQFVGQELLAGGECFLDGKLYYWIREKASSGAETDYVMTLNNNLFPIEVKAGKTGTLKSLHIFSALKKTHKAIRFNTDFPSVYDVKTKTSVENKPMEVNFKLYSLPLYMVSEMNRIMLENS